MSDLDEPLFYDEDFDYAEEFDPAGDLAEHALPSPVWVSYDPDFDLHSPDTDWEDYFSDEFYDEDTAAPEKQEKTGAQSGDTVRSAMRQEPERKRRKTQDTSVVPTLKFPKKRLAALEPTVVWKSKEADSQSASALEDVFVEGQGKKVSLLTDWREKFDIGRPSVFSEVKLDRPVSETECSDLTSLSEVVKEVTPPSPPTNGHPIEPQSWNEILNATACQHPTSSEHTVQNDAKSKPSPSIDEKNPPNNTLLKTKSSSSYPAKATPNKEQSCLPTSIQPLPHHHHHHRRQSKRKPSIPNLKHKNQRQERYLNEEENDIEETMVTTTTTAVKG